MSKHTFDQEKENKLHLAFEWLRNQAELKDEALLLFFEIIRLKNLEKKNKE